MKAIELLKRAVFSDVVDAVPDEPDYNLNFTGIYQDGLTREWAMQTFRRATQWADETRVQNKWYDANSLSNPDTFLEAVCAALVADVIVVSVYAADELPLDLYAWFEAWLPRRPPRVGALTALVGVTEPLNSQSVRTLDYLQAVARKAQLDFLPHKRNRPAASSAAVMQARPEQAGANETSLQRLYGRHYDAYCHWGLNE
jgi:hypothetical protein